MPLSVYMCARQNEGWQPWVVPIQKNLENLLLLSGVSPFLFSKHHGYKPRSTDDIHTQETTQRKQDLHGSDYAAPRIPGSDYTL